MRVKKQQFKRLLTAPKAQSFFLFGPRGTGKTTWLKEHFPKAIYLDLLDAKLYRTLVAAPERLEQYLPPQGVDWVILDEVQRIPELLNEVHRLIESRKQKFILTGSSARKLRKQGVNLLAGRAYTKQVYPLTVAELKGKFSLEHALKWGLLPAIFNTENPSFFLDSYVTTYLKQEVEEEALVRDIGAFARFLEVASLSQGCQLNMSNIAREVGVNRKVVENYFSILQDLMLAYELPVFQKRAERRLLQHPKFYFFDQGVYQTLRPKGPLDGNEELEGVGLETLILHELKALNEYLKKGYQLSFWKSATQLEVDFVLYGENGFKAIEVKRKANLTPKDFRGLKAFLKDYPEAEARIFYGGSQKYYEGKIEVIPFEEGLKGLKDWL
jgi:predicted AAA+ superfamily ATPase